MSRIPHNMEKRNEIFDSTTRLFKEFQIGKLLFQGNAGKMKEIPVIDIFCYLFCLIFSDRSMYMQRKTGVFEGYFCKNTVYSPLNSTRINWQCFTKLLSSRIINDFIKPITANYRKDFFIIDNSLFDRSYSIKFKRDYRLLTLEWKFFYIHQLSTVCFGLQKIKICFAKPLSIIDVPS